MIIMLIEVGKKNYYIEEEDHPKEIEVIKEKINIKTLNSRVIYNYDECE